MALLVATAMTAGAAETMQNPITGQPGASANPPHICQVFTDTPGNSATSPGSVFNTSGISGLHYAGNGAASLTNANSAAAVSQYDIACR
jgi:hypothetical protein